MRIEDSDIIPGFMRDATKKIMEEQDLNLSNKVDPDLDRPNDFTRPMTPTRSVFVKATAKEGQKAAGVY